MFMYFIVSYISGPRFDNTIHYCRVKGDNFFDVAEGLNKYLLYDIKLFCDLRIEQVPQDVYYKFIEYQEL